MILTSFIYILFSVSVVGVVHPVLKSCDAILASLAPFRERVPQDVGIRKTPARVTLYTHQLRHVTPGLNYLALAPA